MNSGFGIDLSGYSTGKTALAFVEIEQGNVRATLLRGSAMSIKRDGEGDLDDALEGDVAVLRRCLALAPVAVDVPIDLQNLLQPARPRKIWELTRRPIDRAVNAMPPFADRIGAPVARFATIMRGGDFGQFLGDRLFEAYPGGALRSLKIGAGKYKGKGRADELDKLCRLLGMRSSVKSDDDLDAIICAITAALPADEIHDSSFFGIEVPLPKGFRIPRSLQFDVIEVISEEFDAWMKERELDRAA